MKKLLAVLLICCMAVSLCAVSVAAGETAGNIAVGDVITFGRYPQTASGADSTPVKWIVLDIRDNKALLLSKYGLDAVPYNDDNNSAVTWETCTLRTWLNDTFLNAAFTQEEAEAILMTQVDNSDSQGYEKCGYPCELSGGAGSGGFFSCFAIDGRAKMRCCDLKHRR